MSAPLLNLQKMPYPEQADQQIRVYANAVPPYISNAGKQAIRMLDLIKNETFGNADKVELLANEWAQCNVMSDSAREFQDATNNLVGYWEGPASQQYIQYSGSATATMNANQAAMHGVATTLANCVKTVYDTYSLALQYIGNCAGDIVGLGGYGVLAAIPGVDIVSIPALIIKVVDTLSNFVKNVTSLVSGAVSQIGSYQSGDTSFLASGNSFRAPNEPGGELGHTNSWVVTNRKSNS